MNSNSISNLKLNLPFFSFKSIKDSLKKKNIEWKNELYVDNPIYNVFDSEEKIKLAAKTNTRIQELLKEHKLPLNVNKDELENLKKTHLNQTRNLVSKIYSLLPNNLKNEVSLPHLQDAAMLHDYGKVLIPPNILNKKGKLNEDEKEIMKMHSEFGFELLKDKNISERTLNLIKYHHQNIKGDGYPRKTNDYIHCLEAQILSTADKYTALREKRCYKNALGKYEALAIIANDVNAGNISQEVYTAFLKSI